MSDKTYTMYTCIVPNIPQLEIVWAPFVISNEYVFEDNVFFLVLKIAKSIVMLNRYVKECFRNLVVSESTLEMLLLSKSIEI